LAEAKLAGRELDGEEAAFLLDCREKDAPFPKIDLQIWAPKATSDRK
jgi:hypothetical protein